MQPLNRTASDTFVAAVAVAAGDQSVALPLRLLYHLGTSGRGGRRWWRRRGEIGRGRRLFDD